MRSRYLGDREAALPHLSQMIERARAEADRLTNVRNRVIADLHAAGLTQERLAAAASVSQPYIARIIKTVPASTSSAATPLEVEFASGPPTGLGPRLATARVRKGLDVQHLAEAAGVSVDMIERAEAGADIPVSVFTKIVQALGKAGWLEDLESLEPTPGERLRAIEQGTPLPVDQGRWHTEQLAR